MASPLPPPMVPKQWGGQRAKENFLAGTDWRQRRSVVNKRGGVGLPRPPPPLSRPVPSRPAHSIRIHSVTANHGHQPMGMSMVGQPPFPTPQMARFLSISLQR